MPETKNIPTKIMDALDERFEIRQVIDDEIVNKNVPAHRTWYEFMGCFGGLSLVFFIVQVLTGLILLTYYISSVDSAFASVQHITNNVKFGWLLRKTHAIGANLMVILVMIHMSKIYFAGAYKKPRELHWVTGFSLLLMLLLTNFSGYMLPWTQLSYWAATVGTSMPETIPIIGPYLVELVRGGAGLSEITLGRFYVLHVAILPMVMVLFMVGHFLMIRKTGIAEPL